MLDSFAVNRLIKNINENARGREVVFFGKHEELREKLKDKGITIDKIFTGNLTLLNNPDFPCFPKEELEKRSDLYYIVMPFFLQDSGVSQRKTLTKYGYTEISDYVFYPLNKPNKTVILKDLSTNYTDEYGNIAQGNNNNVTISILGAENHVYLEKLNINGSLSISIKGNGNTVYIGANTVFKEQNYINISGSNTRVQIANNCSFTDAEITTFADTELLIDEFAFFAKNSKFYIPSFSKIRFGKDCMVSSDVIFQVGDGHSIFDIHTGKNTNYNLEKCDKNEVLASIEIGEHVWIGRRAFVLGGGTTIIENGSIIGAQSFVKGRFPNNCVIAGSPARVVKKDVAWSRKNRSENILDCNGYTNCTREM